MEEFVKQETKKFLKMPSELENIDGVHKEINITLMEDGMPRAVAFFDIDKTLAELKIVHSQTIKKLLKEFLGKEDKDLENVEEVYFKGFKLGNSFREFDRMNGIYNLGHEEWIDPEVYIKERLNKNREEIDGGGSEDHMIAKAYLDRYADMASSVADEIYKNNPEEFESSKIKPIFALAKLYKALGIPMFGMTANGKKFVGTIAKYIGLSDIFIDIATDEDMIGGGKEIIIPKIIERLEKKGVKVPKDRIVLVGDSLRGDIGSGSKFKENAENKEIKIKGILVMKDKKDLAEMHDLISHNPELKKILENTDTEAFVVENVPMDKNGDPLLFSGGRKDFLTKL